jgi:PAS domain S-box-containing protein
MHKKTKKELAKIAEEKDKRFEAFMENSREAVWRIDFIPPLSIRAPEDKIVKAAFNNTIIGEANDMMAKMYGYNKRQQIIGRPLKDFMPQSEPKNKEMVTAFARSRFIIKDMVTYEIKADGSTGVFLNNVTPNIKNDKLLSTWGSSLDITNLKKIEERLELTMVEVEKQKQALNNKNIALRELIAQVEIEKKELMDRVISNLENVILPSFDKIRLNNITGEYLDQHRKTLGALVSSFGQVVSDSAIRLTPREIEVCNLVRNGLNNKEIARLLNISIHTAEKYRRTARKKLGITNKGVNLRSYLISQ